MTLSPAAIFHSATMPWVIVGDSAGIVISWYGDLHLRSGGDDGQGGIVKNGAPQSAGKRKMEISPLGTRADGPSPRVKTGSRVSEAISAHVEVLTVSGGVNDPEYDRYAPARATTLFGATRRRRAGGGSSSDSAARFARLAIAVASAATAVASPERFEAHVASPASTGMLLLHA